MHLAVPSTRAHLPAMSSAASLQPNSTLLAAPSWHPCGLPASLLQTPYAFCGPNNKTTLEFNSLFVTIYNPCSLTGASVQSPPGVFGPNNAADLGIYSLFAPMQPPCSLFAAYLRHPCSPLMHSLAQKSASTLEVDALFSSNVPPWSILAASLCTS